MSKNTEDRFPQEPRKVRDARTEETKDAGVALAQKDEPKVERAEDRNIPDPRA